MIWSHTFVPVLCRLWIHAPLPTPFALGIYSPSPLALSVQQTCSCSSVSQRQSAPTTCLIHLILAFRNVSLYFLSSRFTDLVVQFCPLVTYLAASLSCFWSHAFHPASSVISRHPFDCATIALLNH